MIYLTFSEWAQNVHKVPPVIAVNSNVFTSSELRTKYYADTIFEFVNGNTLYYKDRSGTDYQYAEDEIIMFKLKNG